MLDSHIVRNGGWLADADPRLYIGIASLPVLREDAGDPVVPCARYASSSLDVSMNHLHPRVEESAVFHCSLDHAWIRSRVARPIIQRRTIHARRVSAEAPSLPLSVGITEVG